MGQLPVYFFSNCSFLQHDRDGIARLRQRSDENIDSAAISCLGRRNVDFIAGDGRLIGDGLGNQAENGRPEGQKIGQTGTKQR